jgi:hypothetical protein
MVRQRQGKIIVHPRSTKPIILRVPTDKALRVDYGRLSHARSCRFWGILGRLTRSCRDGLAFADIFLLAIRVDFGGHIERVTGS